MTKTPSLKTRLSGIADSVGKRKDGLYQAKRTFFYTHGYTAEKFKADVQAALPEAKIQEAREKWANWPAQSYWIAVFAIPAPEQKNPEQVA